MTFQSSTAWGLETQRDVPWQERAKCRDADPDAFYPDGDTCHKQIELALSHCRTCPVTSECREYGLDHHRSPTDLHGVWGGLTQAQMRRMLAERLRERWGQVDATCRRCGEVGLKLDGRKLCVDCFHIARRGRYLNKFYNTNPERVHDPLPAADTVSKPRGACGFGHKFDEANTYISPDGKRSCRQCKNGRRTLRRKERVAA